VGTINMSRVILGGLAAGVVIDIGEGLINGVVLAADWAQVMKTMGKPEQMSGGQLAMLNILGLVMGILAVWLYAAIRPRFGAGPRTAVIAGVAFWALAYALPSAAPLIFEFFPARMMMIALAGGIIEVLLAVQVGARIYKEEEAAGAVSAAAAGR